MAHICMLVFNNYSTDPRVRREAEALVERGDTVDCICLGNGMNKITSLAGVRLFCVSAGKYNGSNPLFHVTAYLRFFCYVFVKAAVLHFRKPYDIVQAHTMPDFLVFAALVPKLFGARIILDIHDLMPELYIAKFGSSYRNWAVRFIIWVEKRSVAFADKAIAVHEPHLDILAKHGNPPDKFSIVLNVPDPRIFVGGPARSAPSRRPFRLIYHGSIPRRAGLEVALRAVAHCRKEIPDIEFQIVGAGEDVRRLSGLTQELGLSDCVEFKPGVPVEQLPAILNEAAVGVIPYAADAFTQYVLPTKLMEYAALGIPVIVSRLRTIQRYFDESAVVCFQSGDDVELASQILWLHRNPSAARRLASNAFRLAEAHNWRQQREVYFRLVDSLLPVRPTIFANAG